MAGAGIRHRGGWQPRVRPRHVDLRRGSDVRWIAVLIDRCLTPGNENIAVSEERRAVLPPRDGHVRRIPPRIARSSCVRRLERSDGSERCDQRCDQPWHDPCGESAPVQIPPVGWWRPCASRVPGLHPQSCLGQLHLHDDAHGQATRLTGPRVVRVPDRIACVGWVGGHGEPARPRQVPRVGERPVPHDVGRPVG